MKATTKRKAGQARTTFANLCAATRADNARTAFHRASLATRLAGSARTRGGRVLFALAQAAVERALTLGPEYVAAELDGRDFVARFRGMLGMGVPAVVRLPAGPRR